MHKKVQGTIVRYCFGGTLAVTMAGTDLLNSVVICHPGSVTEEAVQAMKVRIPIVLYTYTFDVHVYFYRFQVRGLVQKVCTYFFASITGRI